MGGCRDVQTVAWRALRRLYFRQRARPGAATRHRRVDGEVSRSGDRNLRRNKRPSNMTAFRTERTLLFVHGATYPAHAAFDLKLGGESWMDYIASRVYDVYLLDLPGYGKSTRPKEMADDPQKNPPITQRDTAVRNIAAVVDHILARRSIP